MGAEKMKERVEFKVSKVLGNSGVIPVSKASPKVKAVWHTIFARLCLNTIIHNNTTNQ